MNANIMKTHLKTKKSVTMRLILFLSTIKPNDNLELCFMSNFCPYCFN